MNVIRAGGLALTVLVALVPAGCGHAPAGRTVPAASAPAAAEASTTDTPAPSTAAAPEPGTTLASSTQDGRLFAVANSAGQGFTIADYVIYGDRRDSSRLAAYDAGGTLLSQLTSGFTADCGVADLTNSKGRLLVTEQVTEKPAEGINPATYRLTMTATDAASGGAVWTADVIAGTRDPLDCANVDDLRSFDATTDGHYGTLLWGTGDTDISLAIDLTDGSLHPRKDLVGVLGNYLLTGSASAQDDNGKPTMLTLTTPDGWPALGHVAAVDTHIGTPTGGEFTPSGWLDTTVNDSQSGDGVTPDGTRLISSHGDDQDNYVDGYTLPGMKRAWRFTTPRYFSDQPLAVTNHLVLLARQGNGGSGGDRLLGLDPATGKQLWSTDVNGGSVCLATASRVLVDVNEQLATLDAGTGKQVGYTGNVKHALLGDEDAGCPKVLGNGLGGVGSVVSGSELTVAQVLAP